MGAVTRVVVLFFASACAAAPEGQKPVVSIRPIPAIDASAPAISVAARETISAAGKTTCFVHEGRVLCFGDEVAASPYGHYSSATATPRAIEGITDAVSISVGETTACALRSGGRVTCFGVVDDGTLGEEGSRGGYKPHVVDKPVEIENTGDVRAVAAGTGFACILRHGTVACFGMNESGELGLAKIGGKLDPVDIGGVAHAKQIAAGANYACARLEDRSVMCWGNHAAAYPLELSDAVSITMRRTVVCATLDSGDVTCVDLAYKTPSTRKLAAIDIASGQHFTCALHKDGTVACDGDLVAAAKSVSDAVAIAAGNDHACALISSGEIRCWGANDAGQSGEEPTVTVRKPTRIAGVSDAIHVVMGAHGGCALQKSGAVSCWGDRDAKIRAADVTDAIAIAGGDRFCAIRRGGKVVCWESKSPSEPLGIDDAVDISIFRSLTCVVRRAGTVSCVGMPTFGLTPELIAGVRDAARVFVGYRRICAVRKNGTAVCWGDDVNFERTKLAEIKDAKDYVEMGMGQPNHVRLKNGEVRAFDWGNSFERGASPPRILPPEPKVIRTQVVQIAQAFYDSCVREQSGTVTCFGSSNEPVPSLFTDAVDVSLTEGGAYCVARINGEVWCWGENEDGECGVDSHVVVETPSHVKP